MKAETLIRHLDTLGMARVPRDAGTIISVCLTCRLNDMRYDGWKCWLMGAAPADCPMKRKP